MIDLNARGRRFPWLAVALISALGCGGRQVTETERQLTTERAQACRMMLTELIQTDLSEASEQALVDGMTRASENAEPCAAAFMDEAQTPGERAIATHEGGQFWLYSFVYEVTLSERFDDYSGYCAIVSDTFRVLVNGLGALEEALSLDTLRDDERRQLQELRDFDLEALDVLLIAVESRCE